MSGTIRHVNLVGSGPTVWLAALVLARFVMPDPTQIKVRVRNQDNSLMLVRPEFQKIAKAIGVQMSHVSGARPVTYWDKGIPFIPYGQPLGAVSMVSLLVKAGVSDWQPFNPAFSACPPTSDAFEVEALSLEQDFKHVAHHIGINEGQFENPDLTIETERSGPVWDGSVLRVGAAISSTLNARFFGLLISQISLMELVRYWPDRSLNPVELNGLARRIEAMMEPVREMQDLINDAKPDTLRRRLWRQAGRLKTIDFDPFSASEWIGALLRQEGVPVDYSVMADAIDRTAIKQHIDAYRIKGPAHV